MTVINSSEERVLLPRVGQDEMWQLMNEHFTRDDTRKWKHLAMLALRENAGWPLEQIGAVFGHSKGHVQRTLIKVQRDLRERFAIDPAMDPPSDETRAPGADVDPDWG